MTSEQREITVNSRKYDGTVRRSWRARVTRFEHPLVALVGEFDRDVHHPDLGLIRKGTVSYEYYWSDRWYNIFRFHEPEGGLRNYYLNLSMPPTFTDDTIDYVDLDIDVVVWADGRVNVLDVEDFERNAAAFEYPVKLRQTVDLELQTLLAMVRRDELPRLDP